MRLRFFVFFLARLSLLGLIRPCSSGRCHGTASCRSPRRLGADPRTNPWAFGPAVEIKGASMQGWMSHRNKLLSKFTSKFRKVDARGHGCRLTHLKILPVRGFPAKTRTRLDISRHARSPCSVQAGLRAAVMRSFLRWWGLRCNHRLAGSTMQVPFLTVCVCVRVFGRSGGGEDRPFSVCIAGV